MKRAIKDHTGDFAAIIVLLILSIVVAGYVLSKERFQFPLIQSSPFIINAEFQTGQAVTPGQGQTVRVSGVQVGQIGNVTLKNGMAMISMEIDPKYKNLIHQDATALLRPKTGLKDMFIELNPGTSPSPVAKPGYTLPVSATNPDINTDEILSALDGDTRSYLQLLINGAGQGLKGKGGTELAQVFERFEPTHRDLARVNKAVAVRGRDLQQLVNSLRRLNVALGQKQTQIVSLVNASSKVFRAFASESGNISSAVAQLPGTLQQTTATLAKVQTFAKLLGPTSTALLPAVGKIPAANRALTALAIPSTPIVKNQIRPFVIAARPTVRQLRPASINLAKATPNLTKTFDVIRHLVNMLGYYPSGNDQHGYLWWLAWLDHNARTLFSIQDANGVFRPLFLQLSCASMNQIAQNITGSSLLLNLEPLLAPTGICATNPSAGGISVPTLPLSKRGGSSSSSSSTTASSSTSSTGSSTTSSSNTPSAAAARSTGSSSSSSTSSSASSAPTISNLTSTTPALNNLSKP